MRHEGEDGTTRERMREGDRAPKGWINLTTANANAPGTGERDTKATIGLTLEPFRCPLVVSQVGHEALPTSAIVILHPLLLVLGKHTTLDHLGLDRYTGESLKAKPAAVVELWFDPDSLHDEGGFDMDTELSGKA